MATAINCLYALQAFANKKKRETTMCLNPKWIYKKGQYKDTNYRGMKGDFYEIGTYSKCGHCEQCINEKSNNWVVRNYYESKAHEKICFVTLTYKTNPIFLIKSDIQKFIKRLRQNLKRKYNFKDKIRYFQAGEYGTLTSRPHFHLIIYNWTDENKYYLGINNKKQILYQSKIIEETWGFGRTSIQEFNTREIPYISLYETPKEIFSRAYKLNTEKIKKIKEIYRRYDIDKKRRKELEQNLKHLEKELDKTKEQYILIKEFNTWSIALGWEEFEKQYIKSNNYVFEEYIEDKTFVTPTPWVKKLANMGDIQAIKEMYRREEELQTLTLEEEKTKNRILINKKNRNKNLEWVDKKTRLDL